MIPNVVKISKIVEENPSVKTFYFDHALNGKPGQFVMLWLPEIDQKPFSISYDDGKTFGLTIFKRGPLTEKLFTLGVGDKAWFTGPFGTNYTMSNDRHYIMVAGGYGAAPLANLASNLNGAKIDFIIGARSKDLLLFEKQLLQILNLSLHVTTDDGTAGQKGRVTDVLRELLDNKSDNIMVVTCGPELMEKAVLDLCNEYNVDCELSIERHMKCGIGVCGQCAVDDLGICMCVDGPVVNRETATKIFEFGKYHRDKTGNKINF